MSYNRSHARQLCTRPELALFEASLADAIGSHTPAVLKSKIARARNLRDKYRDLHRRQSLKTRARTGAKHGRVGTSDLRTQQKAKLFDEALERFEARAGRLREAEAREARQAAASARSRSKSKTKKKVKRAARATKAPRSGAAKTVSGAASARAKKKRAVRTARGYTSQGAEATAHARKLAASRSRPIQAHVGARNRRAQAKRDSR